ncbi:lytic polysaccharide monooxygenase [Streptomyces sp. JJ38]|uniref:lytic polysaccharide monooxygenase auxiliary activity family 9 protein n=1 Tax=Streptomyces sp. JJ38 TaxID=2738128 RepID=UPI001C58DFAE|nr:lytic polysaccharide monooxygenase [Streptomyces sp. JJ38]MBW1595601.1 lytic polysaccharide monooxygenase [Streptomyces sp. JJ38]
MSARTTAGVAAVAAAAPLLLLLPAEQASAHGTMYDPVSRVAACYAEGPEHPDSQVCKDLIAESGTQPLYDWNEVNLANVNGRHQEVIPDGKLCSAGREKYKALDWARTDWAATPVSAGAADFRFRVTAPHLGTMTVYITKEGYDPTKPLKWSDLDPTPVAVADVTRSAPSGYYEFGGTLPERTGRHLLYKIWQRSDSPEAFYSCSDVTFSAAASAESAPKAPTEQQIADGLPHSTVSHHGHGGAPAGEQRTVLPQTLAGVGAVGLTAACFLLSRLSRRRPGA